MKDYFRTIKMAVGYNRKPLMEQIEIGLSKGEILTLIGPNGSGKSTILKSIAGQLALLGGTIMLGSSHLEEMSLSRRAQSMAVLLTERLRTEMMTCEDVVATGRYPYTGRFGILSEKDREAVAEAMKLVHVEELKDQDFTRISDGQRQRIMLARAICQEPEILILDEPTSYLDVKYKLEFLSVLQEMKRKKKLTVIMSLHEIELAEIISDHILCIREHRVDRMGTPAEVLDKVPVPHPSSTVKKATGSGSVAEAAAILSAEGGPLLVGKQKGQTKDFTYAIAISKSAIQDEEDSQQKGKQGHGHIEIVGAGPGDPELISIRGRRMLENADLILYAGSLVPKELTLCAKKGSTIRSSADMNLEEQFALIKKFYDKGKFIVRLHTGDPCIYGAIQEQMAFFDRYGMSYHITPGISSFQAAAAALRSQFTIPEKVQTIILTRGEGRTPMPEKEQLHKLAASQSTMCIFLSAGIAGQVQKELLEHYPPTTPVAACYKLTWKDERIYRGELKDLEQIVKENNLTLTTLLVVGDAIDNRTGVSRLYAEEFKHLYRR